MIAEVNLNYLSDKVVIGVIVVRRALVQKNEERLEVRVVEGGNAE